MTHDLSTEALQRSKHLHRNLTNGIKSNNSTLKRNGITKQMKLIGESGAMGDLQGANPGTSQIVSGEGHYLYGYNNSVTTLHSTNIEDTGSVRSVTPGGTSNTAVQRKDSVMAMSRHTPGSMVQGRRASPSSPISISDDIVNKGDDTAHDLLKKDKAEDEEDVAAGETILTTILRNSYLRHAAEQEKQKRVEDIAFTKTQGHKDKTVPLDMREAERERYYGHYLDLIKGDGVGVYTFTAALCLPL